MGGYANIGTVDDVTGWTADPAVTGEACAAAAAAWLRLGARLIGGCCRVGPADVRAIAAALGRA